MINRNELLSNEVQELINYRPHWIIRKGNGLFFLVLLLLLAFTLVIHYPDVIEGQVKLEAIGRQYYGRLLVTPTGRDKIRTGQKVVIRIEHYPGHQVGYLSGTVSDIPAISIMSDSFPIKVDLPRELQPHYNKTIFFRNDLAANAEVITTSRTLSDRIWGQLKKMTGH